MSVGLQPVYSHYSANKSSLLATVSIQRQIICPWHTSHTAKQHLPFDHYVGTLKIHRGQVGLETGKYRHFLKVSFPVMWISKVMILGAVQVVSAVVGPHTSKGTFLSLAAPVPERMASIKACLAFTVLLRVLLLKLETVMEADGSWEAGVGGGGRVGGCGRPRSSC